MTTTKFLAKDWPFQRRSVRQLKARHSRGQRDQSCCMAVRWGEDVSVVYRTTLELEAENGYGRGGEALDRLKRSLFGAYASLASVRW